MTFKNFHRVWHESLRTTHCVVFPRFSPVRSSAKQRVSTDFRLNLHAVLNYCKYIPGMDDTTLLYGGPPRLGSTARAKAPHVLKQNELSSRRLCIIEYVPRHLDRDGQVRSIPNASPGCGSDDDEEEYDLSIKFTN